MFEELKLKYKLAKMTTETYMTKFNTDTSGEAPIKALFMLFILAVLAGALLPAGIDALAAGKNSSGDWTNSETTTYAIIGIMIIVAVVILISRIALE